MSLDSYMIKCRKYGIVELLAEWQSRRGAVISLEKVDVATLKRIAGGGSGVDFSNADDCDKHFKECSGGFLAKGDRCTYLDFCDENFDSGAGDRCMRYDQNPVQCVANF